MSWKKVKLNKILKQYRIEHLVQNDILYKQVSILNNGKVILRGEKIGNDIGRKRQFVIDTNKYPNTLIFTRQLLLQGSIGIARNDVNKCIVTENMPMFSIDDTIVEVDYLNLFLRSDEFRRQVAKIELTGSAQKSIHERTFLELEISLPSYENQKEIVKNFLAFNNNNFKLSSELSYQLDLIKQLRQAFLREAMQGKLVPQNPKDEPASELLKRIKAEKEKSDKPGKAKKQEAQPIKPEEIPFEIPKNWEWCELKDICLKIADGTHNSPINTSEGKFKYITAKNITNDGIDLNNVTFISEDVHKAIYARCNPEFGDILFIKDGATTGITTLNDLHEEFSLLSSVALLKVFSEFNNKFLVYSLRSPIIYDSIRKNMFGVAITRVTLEKINNFIVPLPPLAEQNRIVAKLEELMKYCDELEQSIKTGKDHTEMLLQQVLREALRGEEK